MAHYYFQGATRVLSLIVGFFAGVVAQFFVRTPIAIAIGAICTIVASLVLALLFFLEDRPYRICCRISPKNRFCASARC